MTSVYDKTFTRAECQIQEKEVHCLFPVFDIGKGQRSEGCVPNAPRIPVDTRNLEDPSLRSGWRWILTFVVTYVTMVLNMTTNRWCMARKMAKGKVKAIILEVFREVEQTGEEVIITDRNVEVCKIVPIEPKKSLKENFQALKGKLKYEGELTSPDTDDWEEA